MRPRFPAFLLGALTLPPLSALLGGELIPRGTRGASEPTAPPAEAPSLRDVEVVRRRMLERWTSDGKRLVNEVLRNMKVLRADGSFPDVDYADRGRSGWKTVSHLYRVKSMATVYRLPAVPELEDRPRLREATLSALRFWVERDFRNPNWWWNEIGVPMALGPALLLLGDAVPDEVRSGGVKILERARLGRGTGQNLVWLTEMALVRGCVTSTRWFPTSMFNA